MPSTAREFSGLSPLDWCLGSGGPRGTSDHARQESCFLEAKGQLPPRSPHGGSIAPLGEETEIS